MGNNGGRPHQDTGFSGRKIRELQSLNLPDLFGPVNGYYYHKKDKQKVIENNEQNKDHVIPIIFKYTGIDLENIQKDLDENKNKNKDEEDNKDDDNDNNEDLESLKEYQNCRFEWVYFVSNDPNNKPYRKINDKSYKLPKEYETIREYLSKYDPIPPHFLRKAKMAGKVMDSVCDSRLQKMQHLKCKIITKNVSDNPAFNVYHPALLIWDPSEKFGAKSDDRGYMIHLIKLPLEYQSEEAKENENMEEMEIECRAIFRKELDEKEWIYNKYKTQDLKLENGLTDIGHWCLKYEMKNEYKYQRYKNDCIQFMMEMCNEFKIIYDAKDWSNLPYEISKVSNKICGSF